MAGSVERVQLVLVFPSAVTIGWEVLPHLLWQAFIEFRWPFTGFRLVNISKYPPSLVTKAYTEERSKNQLYVYPAELILSTYINRIDKYDELCSAKGGIISLACVYLISCNG